MDTDNKYHWKFRTVGGVTRVCIESGEDVAHLGELDQKLWTVLSCPVQGLEMDSRTLGMLDTDGDGKIHVKEVVDAATWLTSVLKNPDDMFSGEDTLSLDSINVENPEGESLFRSARQILSNLSLAGKDSISIADTSDSVAIFAGTAFNGDGVITEDSTPDEDLKNVIAKCVATVGSSMDRSGKAGVNAAQIEEFYESCAAYAAWKTSADESVFPFGDRTAEALASLEAVSSKVEDFFLRCKLAAFNESSAALLDVSDAKIAAVGEKNLCDCSEEISTYPVAHVNAEGILPLKKGLNPSWSEAVAAFASIAVPEADTIDEGKWREIISAFDPYKAWISSKAGDKVESLGFDVIENILNENRKQDLLDLVASDEALRSESESIDAVDKLLHYYRDLNVFLKNFVTFSDFYSLDSSTKAIFQAGVLYIDQRSCDLCVKVSDMGKQGDMAGQSGMFIIYCDCTSKTKGEKMVIAAVMTEGDVSRIREGMNCLFYDRDGNDWDATVIKVVENPISVAQAFWTPYRKLARFVENLVSKMSSDKDSEVTDDLTAKVSTVTAAPGEAPKQPFDIGKFAGIFAALGLALGAIFAALTAVLKAFVSLKLWQMILVIAAVLLIISGPAMISAWLKLRKRNLAPLLNANGWAINSKALVNSRFGAQLTSLADYPKVVIADPYESGKKGRKWIIAIVVAVICAVAAYCLFGSRAQSSDEDADATEVVISSEDGMSDSE